MSQMMLSAFTAIGSLRAVLGEGPVWDDERQCLWFVDIDRHCVHALDPLSGTVATIPTGRAVGAIGLCRSGALMLAFRGGFARITPDAPCPSPELVAAVESEQPRHRMNDGAVDSHGRFWAGTLSEDRDPTAALYRLDPGGAVSRHVTEVTISNGIDWSPDDTQMYYVDTPTGRIDVFDFVAAAGTIRHRRPFVIVPSEAGKPDGLVVDADGAVWVALWGGAALHRYLPDGTLDCVCPVPARYPTKMSFGGPNLTDLFVTSASAPLTDAQREQAPLAGAVFTAAVRVAGRRPHRFRD